MELAETIKRAVEPVRCIGSHYLEVVTGPPFIISCKRCAFRKILTPEDIWCVRIYHPEFQKVRKDYDNMRRELEKLKKQNATS